MTTAQVLTKAMKLIEAGWCQGRGVAKFKDGSVAYCPVGAISRAGGSEEEQRILRDVIRKPSIFAWNDRPSRRKSHVLAAFRKAIELAKERQA